MSATPVATPSLAQQTPLFPATHRGGRIYHVAVHIRRGDMVYRNFAEQLSPDGYFVQAMWHVLTLVSAAEARRQEPPPPSAAGGAVAGPALAPPSLIFHIFSQPPPRSSWTGRSKVPVHTAASGDETYVDELGCLVSLREQLALLAAGGAGGVLSLLRWDLRMHLEEDPVSSLLHMARADVLVASDSSFSLAAAVLSRGLVLARLGWKRFPRGATAGMLHPLRVSDDGSIDAETAMRAWDASAGARPLGAYR